MSTSGRRRVPHEVRGLEQELHEAGFVYTRGGNHALYKHPTGVTAILVSSKPGADSYWNTRAQVHRNIKRAKALEAEQAASNSRQEQKS